MGKPKEIQPTLQQLCESRGDISLTSCSCSKIDCTQQFVKTLRKGKVQQKHQFLHYFHSRMSSLSYSIQGSCSSRRHSLSPQISAQHRASPSPSVAPLTLLKELQQNSIYKHVRRTVKETSVRFLDAFVDFAFDFKDQPLLPSQSNFAPVEEVEKEFDVSESINGKIPSSFPVGVYIRNGPNPLFGCLKSVSSIFGRSSHCWIEGEGMLHALYILTDGNSRWKVTYKNKYVDTETFKLDKERKKPAFLPSIEGDSLAVLTAYILNVLRFDWTYNYLSNTSVFEHSGKVYSAAESHIPQEIDISTLGTRGNWDVNGAWKRAFTAHPKKDPRTGELVIVGISPQKPYLELGVISADGKKLLHKVDLKLDRSIMCHEIGITQRYNVIMDLPLAYDVNRLISGGSLLKYDEEGYARIGIMPRNGHADSVKWFEVETCCVFHIVNCYEQNDEVVVLACRAPHSMIPGPEFGLNKFEWLSKGFKKTGTRNREPHNVSFFSHVYEWRLNMLTGEVVEKYVTGNEYSLEFPVINEKYCGRKNNFAYTQVVDWNGSSTSGMAKFGGLAKLYFDEIERGDSSIKVEYHKFPEKTFCSGASFVPKCDGAEGEEDDGWIITYVHDEQSDRSQVYIVDAKNLSSKPVAVVTLPTRVPYGFHGCFVTANPGRKTNL